MLNFGRALMFLMYFVCILYYVLCNNVRFMHIIIVQYATRVA